VGPYLPLQPHRPGAGARPPQLRQRRLTNPIQYPVNSAWRSRLSETVAGKTPWQRVQNARHPKRPHTLDYIERILTDFQEIHGDRLFGDDPAIICGMGASMAAPSC